MKWTTSISYLAVVATVSCGAFQMPQDPTISRRNAFESLTKVLFGAIVPPSIATSQIQNAFALSPVSELPRAILPFAFDVDHIGGTSSSALMESPTSVYLTQSGPRAVLLNTENTIRSTFFGYVDRLEFTKLLNSYNTFNSATRAAATTLANQYNQQARKNTLFSAMNAMASAAQQQNQSLCRFKTQATVNSIDDFLDHVGS